jgi:hypothetical protein
MLLLIRKKTADRHERNLNQDRPAPQAKTDFSMSRGKKEESFFPCLKRRCLTKLGFALTKRPLR